MSTSPAQSPSSSSPKLSPIASLTDNQLLLYLQNFLDISKYRSISQGRALLDCIMADPHHPKVRTVFKRLAVLFACDVPQAKVCSLQFIREAVERGQEIVEEFIEEMFLVHFEEIMMFRSHIKSLMRGSTFFVRDITKETKDQEMTNFIKLSSTFFRMIHECLYVWANFYFPGSEYEQLYLKMKDKVVFPKYPTDFKFYSQPKVDKFCKQKLSSRRNSNRSSSQSNRKSKESKDNSKNGKQLQLFLKEQTRRSKGQTQKVNINSSKTEIIKHYPPKQVKIQIKQKQIDEEDDIMMVASSSVSKIIKKGDKSKIKIPPNLIYRESSIEGAEDRTQQIDRLDFKMKSKISDLPLGVIAEDSDENKTTVKAESLKNSRTQSELSSPLIQKQLSSEVLNKNKLKRQFIEPQYIKEEDSDQDGGRYSILEEDSNTANNTDRSHHPEKIQINSVQNKQEHQQNQIIHEKALTLKQNSPQTNQIKLFSSKKEHQPIVSNQIVNKQNIQNRNAQQIVKKPKNSIPYQRKRSFKKSIEVQDNFKQEITNSKNKKINHFDSPQIVNSKIFQKIEKKPVLHQRNEVNLMIQPQTKIQSITQSLHNSNIVLSQSIENRIESKIQEQFNFLKKQIFNHQNHSQVNNFQTLKTQFTTKSIPIPYKKDENKLDYSTQTIKHKYKTKKSINYARQNHKVSLIEEDEYAFTKPQFHSTQLPRQNQVKAKNSQPITPKPQTEAFPVSQKLHQFQQHRQIHGGRPIQVNRSSSKDKAKRGSINHMNLDIFPQNTLLYALYRRKSIAL